MILKKIFFKIYTEIKSFYDERLDEIKFTYVICNKFIQEKLKLITKFKYKITHDLQLNEFIPALGQSYDFSFEERKRLYNLNKIHEDSATLNPYGIMTKILLSHCDLRKFYIIEQKNYIKEKYPEIKDFLLNTDSIYSNSSNDNPFNILEAITEERIDDLKDKTYSKFVGIEMFYNCKFYFINSILFSNSFIYKFYKFNKRDV
jgi:hypothetical protein